MMKAEKLILRIIDNDAVTKSTLEIIETGNLVQLDFQYKDIFISEMDEFPFVALNKVRLKLEDRRLKLICQGSRIDVNQSGMQAVGFYAYELELSKPAINSVYIFDDTTQIKKIATVKEQEAFYDKWLKSVGFSELTDKIDVYDPQNTIGSYWYIINLENWETQSSDFKKGIISSIEQELKKISESGLIEFPALKDKFEKKLDITLKIV